MTHDDFLQAIIESPDDDAPRLVYTDWLDEHGDADRAEFIRVQCELAKLPTPNPRRALLEAREQELLTEYEEWAAPFRWAKEWRFRRGFIAEIEVDADAFLAKAELIFTSAPITHVQLGWRGWGANAAERFQQLAECPFLDRLQSLDLAFGHYQICNNDLRALAMFPAILQRLQRLSVLECSINEDGLWALFTAPALVSLRSLSLDMCDLRGADGMQPLTGSSAGSLTDLSLDNMDLTNLGVEALFDDASWPHLRSLSLSGCRVGNSGVDAIVSHDATFRLESLILSNNAVADIGAQALARSRCAETFERLGFLLLHRNAIGNKGALALAESKNFRQLRSLSLFENHVGQAGEDALRARFGDRVQL
jgi:uncharacterized protein (TIGR02996 family)